MLKVHRGRLAGTPLHSRNGAITNCPNCYVNNIRWRVRKQLFICNRCGQEFDAAGNMVPAKPQREPK